MEAELALHDGDQHLPAGREPDAALEVGPARLERHALLPQVVQPPRGAESRRLPAS